MGIKPKYIWEEVACKFLLETQNKTTHEDNKSKSRWLQQFLRDKPLCEINRELISHIAQIKARDASNSTANRLLALN